MVILILIRDLWYLKHHPLVQNITKNNFWTRLNKKFYPFRGPGKIWIIGGIIILLAGIIIATDSRFIEIWRIKITNISIINAQITQPIKIAWLTDLQVGNHKRNEWLNKVVLKLEKINPDLILLGGDLIDNEGTLNDETKYLEPLKKLADRYPMYYVLGNHEYGIGGAARDRPKWQTGDRSDDLIKKMEELNIPLLRNQLICAEIAKQPICIFGVDDFWARPVVFDDLKNWNCSIPLIYIMHNPDAIKFWPEEIKKPDLALAGHTHGGQVWLPVINRPLSSAETELGYNYYRGLKYWQDIPIYISTGLGESGGPIRFFAPPEIAVINLTPTN